jgi:hypothetical protein
MAKQRTVTGAYSDENFNDSSKDKIRNVDWGPYEGSATPRARQLPNIDRDNSMGSGPVSESSVSYRPRKMD